MKRGTKCVVQTINLSNPQTCVRPKVQKLVNANEDALNSTHRSSWISPRPVAVKICSVRDVKYKTCPPKIQIADSYEVPVTSGRKLCRIAIFLVKSALAFSLVRWTYSEGLWGDSSQTQKLYYRMMSAFDPDRPEQLPHLKDVTYSLSEMYNDIVMTGMHVIVNVPREIYRRINEILSTCGTTKKETDEKYEEIR